MVVEPRMDFYKEVNFIIVIIIEHNIIVKKYNIVTIKQICYFNLLENISYKINNNINSKFYTLNMLIRY